MKKNGVISKKEVEQNLEKYFDGLMAVVNKEQDKILPKTKVNLLNKKITKGIESYKGNIELHDSFITKVTFTLNVETMIHRCSDEESKILVFRFSPKGFDHEVWNKLHDVKLKEKICEN